MTYEEMLQLDDNEQFISILDERTASFERIFDLLNEMISWEEQHKTIEVNDSETGTGAMLKRLFTDKTKSFGILSFMKNLDSLTNSENIKEAIFAKVAMDRVYLGKP